MDSRSKRREFRASTMLVQPQQATRGASSSSSARPSSGEASLSFEDELAATIHGAFEVAVEIAVLEVSKLVGQALADVRDQMHETLRENRSLKERLLVAERELDALRGTSVDGSALHEKVVRWPKSPPGSIRVGVSAEMAAVDADSSEGSFREIREDGQVRSQHWTHGPPQSADLPERSAAEGNCVNVCGKNHPVGIKFDQEHTEAAAKDGSTSPGSDIKQVHVKEEEKEVAGRSDPSSGVNEVTGDEFEAECLSRAQSKLLEDWRPEPLEDSNTDFVAPCTSHTLPDPSVFNSVTTHSNGLVPAAGGFPLFAVPFTNPFHSGDAELVSTSQQPYSLHTGSSSSASSSAHRMHVCSDCGMPFQQLAELRRHSQQHGSVPPRSAKRPALPPGCSPYHCSHCGRDFNRLENLKTHLRIHTGERPYSCSVCGVRFRHSGALTRHFRIHTGEKPYVCSQCGKTFRNCGGLRFHQRSHVREGQSAVD